MSDHSRAIGQDPLASIADSRDSADSPTVGPPHSLDSLPLIERKYGIDARSEPSQGDIEHLCKVWAGVVRAILTRRQQANEQEEVTYEGSSLP